ncbi:hypothetical protein [Halobacillus salinus]|uniref:Uncharacterized protein n=1 Tax=Halobacillus salinus TaxID=192814 RepID=A0A4Z0H4H5_9BACI|nr:hypothetical protein [Halobacillus salinus]TGB04689.1 hypothetical protein E4663_06775 [Halobacillus salinus]
MAKYELINVGGTMLKAAITNHSLSMGEKLGYLEKSQLTDLLELGAYKAIVYLAVIGPYPGEAVTVDAFEEYYSPSDERLRADYMRVLEACTLKEDNEFAKGLRNSLDRKAERDQPKIKSPKLTIECVEDRYVLYCLGAGIGEDVFWHYPIPDVERIYESKQALDAWKNNPATQGK